MTRPSQQLRWRELEQVFVQLFQYLALKDIIRVCSLSKASLFAVLNTLSSGDLTLSFDDRLRIRRQIFEERPEAALPSLLTHVLPFESAQTSGDVLRCLLTRPNTLRCFRHLRSGKEFKLHHPFYFQKLPLRYDRYTTLPPLARRPQDIPLPHDLSLCDILQIFITHHESLEKFEYSGYDTCPLPWNSAPSRTCPRDIIGNCLREADEATHQAPDSSVPGLPYRIRVWCPECKYAGADHGACWLKAGNSIVERLLAGLASDEERSSLQSGHLVFDRLQEIRLSGWTLSNCLALLRMLGLARFPALKKLTFQGILLIAPSLTDPKDQWPRPRLKNPEVMPDAPPRASHLIQLAQCASVQSSPFSRRYPSKDAGDYIMGLFNGSLWTATTTFPLLEEVSLRVGTFDDESRWITPWFEHCLSFAPKLRVMEIDHCVVQLDEELDPLLRLFSMISPEFSRFPALEVVKIKLIDSPILLARLEHLISDLVARPIRVQARKILVPILSPNAEDLSRLICTWPNRQRTRFPKMTVTDHALSCFSEDSTSHPSNGLLVLDFGTDIDGPNPHLNHASGILDFGSHASKVMLKHYTPSSDVHTRVLERCRFGGGDISRQTTTANDEDCPHSRHTTGIRRIDVQLEIPHVWQVTESEAKHVVELQIGLLRKQLRAHHCLSKCPLVRVACCPRLTYGGNNWNWWQELITGEIGSASPAMTSQGWTRESPLVIPEQDLVRYQCDHMTRAQSSQDNSSAV